MHQPHTLSGVDRADDAVGGHKPDASCEVRRERGDGVARGDMRLQVDAIVDVELPPLRRMPMCHTQNRAGPVGDDHAIAIVEIPVHTSEQPTLGQLLACDRHRGRRIEERHRRHRDLQRRRADELGTQRHRHPVASHERRGAGTAGNRRRRETRGLSRSGEGRRVRRPQVTVHQRRSDRTESGRRARCGSRRTVCRWRRDRRSPDDRTREHRDDNGRRGEYADVGSTNTRTWRCHRVTLTDRRR